LSITVLDGSTFCVCDERGDVDGLATASGFFASDTRFLSRSLLTLGGARLDPLSHNHSAPHLASFVLRNPLADGLQPNELVIERERFVGYCMEERIVVQNHSHRRIDVELGLELAADFADIFVVKDLEPGFGRPLDVTLPPTRPPERAGNGTLVFSDTSFAGRTVVHFSEPFDESGGVARFALSLEPGAGWRSSREWRLCRRRRSPGSSTRSDAGPSSR
jgi:glycogen debranching enzyme